MNLDETSILTEFNEYYKNKVTKEVNDRLKKHEVCTGLLSIPMYTEDIIIGGCPREITFTEIGFPTSDLDLYKIEKKEKNEFILMDTIEEFYKFLKNKYKDDKTKYVTSTIEYEPDELIDTKRNSLVAFQHCSNITDLKTDKRTMFFHHLVQSDKSFREPDEMIVTKLMPGIITAFKTIPNCEEVVIILKHVHSFEEKAISFTVSDYLDSQVLVINNQPTSFDINKYYDIIVKNIKEINECIRNKEFSNVKNINYCTECYFKMFCETLP